MDYEVLSKEYQKHFNWVILKNITELVKSELKTVYKWNFFYLNYIDYQSHVPLKNYYRLIKGTDETKKTKPCLEPENFSSTNLVFLSRSGMI